MTDSPKLVPIPDDVLAAVLRLEEKRLRREKWEADIDRADAERKRKREEQS